MDVNILHGLETELEGFQSLEELFRLYQPAPSTIGQVEKIVERLVERVVEVPKLIPVDRIVEKVVTV